MSGLDAIRVVLLVLVVLDVIGWFLVPTPAVTVGGAKLPLLVLALMIGLAEIAAIHLDIGRDRHTISMAEFPFTLGLFLVLPRELLLAQLVGLALELALVRRQAPLKLAFNLAQTWLSSIVGILVFHAMLPPDATAADPQSWLVGAIAAVASAAFSVVVVSHVIALMDGRIGLQNLRESMTNAALGALGNSSLGLLVVALVAVAPRALVLLMLPIGALFTAYRMYERQRAANRALSFLYNISQSLAGETEVDTSLADLTETVRERMNVRRAVIVVAPSGGDPLATGIISAAEEGTGPQVDHRRLTELEHAAVAALYASGSVLVTRSGGSSVPGFDRSLLEQLDAPGDAVVVSLHGPDRPLGFVLVSERLGDLDTLTSADQELLVAVGNQLSTSLTAARLENSLSELHRLQETLRHRADHDALTGLCNRFRFTTEVDAELQHSPDSTAVLFLDLDDFKTINDSMGHHVGDELLRAVARRLEGAIKVTDLVARLGGDEFAVLLRDVADNRAEVVAERLAFVLSEPFELESGAVNVGTSVGIAKHDGDEPPTAATILRNADAAMYAAKRDGGTTARAFEQSMHDEARARLQLRNDLQRGLGKDEFDIHFQALVDLDSEHVIGAEALLRWNHPKRGLLGPDVFLDLAEETGMMREIGLRVLRRACSLAVPWPRDTIVSVNLSRSQLLSDTELVDEVDHILALTGLPPERLLLEITEFAVMSNIDRSIQVLSGLADLGVRIALDDFGTGHSSLQHLARLPVHVLKIAKPFVDGVGVGHSEPARPALVAHGIIEMAHALALDTIAEGIERREQAEVLHRWGARVGQGYLLGRPMHTTDFAAAVGWPLPPAGVALAPASVPGSAAAPAADAPGRGSDA